MKNSVTKRLVLRRNIVNTQHCGYPCGWTGSAGERRNMRILVPLATTVAVCVRGSPRGQGLRWSDPGLDYIVAMTVLDGYQQAVTLSGGEDANCVVTGLTITGANRGIYCSRSSPTVSNCHFLRNLSVGMEGFPDATFRVGGPKLAGDTKNPRSPTASSPPTLMRA